MSDLIYEPHVGLNYVASTIGHQDGQGIVVEVSVSIFGHTGPLDMWVHLAQGGHDLTEANAGSQVLFGQWEGVEGVRARISKGMGRTAKS